jgi:hypothetical protein
MPLKTLGTGEHNHPEQWVVEFHPEFAREVRGFSDSVRREIYTLTGSLRRLGPLLGRSQVDTLSGSKYSNMKELRFHADDGPWRVAFAFDPSRRAILLAGGDKSGVSQAAFYRNLIKTADLRFGQHLRAISAKKEE